MQFLKALAEFPFLQHALLCGLLASIAAGVMGSYVVTRRLTYLAGSIAHFVLGGMGAARYLQTVYHWSWLTPLHGAIFAALLAAVIVSLVSRRGHQREDTVIGALWAVGMAVGILFISRTPGYNEDLMSYLFGNILLVTPEQLWLLVLLDAMVLTFGVLFYHPFVAICFDEEFARVRGLPVDLLYGLMLVLTSLTVVVLLSVVGLVMVIALLTLPAAIASLFSRRMWQVMVLAALLSTVFVTSGLALSYSPNWPAGATIILIAAAGYLLTVIGRLLWRKGFGRQRAHHLSAEKRAGRGG